MKVVLKYSDCLSDGKNVFRVLSTYNIEILKTKQKSYSIYPEITIRIKDSSELNKLVHALNCNCVYEVRVVSVKSEDSFFERIKRIWE